MVALWVGQGGDSGCTTRPIEDGIDQGPVKVGRKNPR
jgi:hypothetical protein